MFNQFSFNKEKEKDFIELNHELEEKVKSLMVEVDSIINKQEDVMQGSKSSKRRKFKIKENQVNKETTKELSANNEIVLLEKSLVIENDNEKIDTDDEFESDDEDDGSKKKIRTTIIRFLKAQVTKLQTDLKASQYETKKKNEKCTELEAEIKKQEEKKEKLHSQLVSHKETILKAEAQNSELQSKILALSTEISTLKKEVDGLKKDLKALNQLSSNSDIRLNRSLEENEKLRSSLKASQAEERELREQIRKIQEEKRLALKTSEKQRTEIFQAFKKQTQLVDNLKKQKAYLEASKEIQFIEEDFTRLLDWKPDKA